MEQALAKSTPNGRPSQPKLISITGSPDRASRLPDEPSSVDRYPISLQATPPSIADDLRDLLELLTPPKRKGMIAYLSVRYYDGWRPSRLEVADLIAVELGLLSFDDYVQRKNRRRAAEGTVRDIIPMIKDRQRHHSAW